MPTNRYFIDFSYDGSSYHGFQNQLNANTSIDGVAGWFSVAMPFTQHELPFASQQTATPQPNTLKQAHDRD